MYALIGGLVLFLGIHSVRIFAEGWRDIQIERWGQNAWMGVYAAISLIGFGLIVWSFGQARLDTIIVWHPPYWTRYLTAALTLPAFILLAAAYVPATNIKRRLGHPMILSVKTWALAHLFANGSLADIILFGGFLLWAVLDFRVSRRRNKAAGINYPAAGIGRDVLAVVLGFAGWAVFAVVLHKWLIGVKPF